MSSRVHIRCRLTLFDGTQHDARVIGADASTDVAVLVIDVPAEKLVPLGFGDSSRLLVGQKILALGNPFGLERTLTSGIISSLDRSLKAKNGRMIKGIIQTDAAINPGNSGGPLLNSRGQVIGLNTAIVSQVGQSAGISFAVPINPIARILDQLITNGRVIRADLGITRVYSTGDGLLVVDLVEGGPAAQAGIQPIRVRVEQIAPGIIRRSIDRESADMIVAVDHKRVRTVEELLNEVEKHRPGDTVSRDHDPGGPSRWTFRCAWGRLSPMTETPAWRSGIRSVHFRWVECWASTPGTGWESGSTAGWALRFHGRRSRSMSAVPLRSDCAAEILSRWSPHAHSRLVVIVGFLGGYTTFSSYSYESMKLWERGERGLCLAYMFGSVAAGFGGVILGTAPGRGLTSGSS